MLSQRWFDEAICKRKVYTIFILYNRGWIGVRCPFCKLILAYATTELSENNKHLVDIYRCLSCGFTVERRKKVIKREHLIRLKQIKRRGSRLY